MNRSISDKRIKYYDDYLSPEIFKNLSSSLTEIKDVKGMSSTAKPRGLETTEGLKFLQKLYTCVKPELNCVLEQRQIDREFIDQRVKALYESNTKLKNDYFSTDYQSIIGLEDAQGRKVIGPHRTDYCLLDKNHKESSVAPIPEYLKGVHVTLFGPPDTKKMAINAMNAFHRQLKDEPQIVAELLKDSTEYPKWGADDEDSKTPMHDDLVDAGVNLTDCFTREIKVDGDTSGKYNLKDEKLSLPIKRFPGLALPSFFLFHENEPVPLHLYDFALHLYANWNRPEALVFYVPKLENEEEARYIKNMIESAETLIKEEFNDYEMGTVRLMIVLENPRAVFRVNEMMDELYPYFAGASLGWHDYLGSAARLFKEDPNYRIPVKADPDIVIKYIKGSHDLLANVVGPRGGIKVGGMYGILPLDNDRFGESFQATLKGFFRDVITQMKRDLTGYWVAHPDFVRIGIAIVEAWKKYASGDENPLMELISSLLKDEYKDEVVSFLKGKDIEGLDQKDPLYARSLIVADVGESNIIPNNDPEEIRYNVFQSLQYLTDWLSGNGCVALPAIVGGIPVRVMDDLATAERSRWEVWHELYHKRFALEDFIQIAFEELNFIRKDLSNDKKIVQVKWTEENAKWYPVAFQLMLKLMTDHEPVEFATQLLLPFTLDQVQKSKDPWAEVKNIDSEKFSIRADVNRLAYYYEMCGELGFAKMMARDLITDFQLAETLIKSFDKEQILSAASFHGDIGKKKNLDKMAENEQSKVDTESKETKEILKLADEYIAKFGFKFLVSAKGKSETEMLEILKSRIENTLAQEIENARSALWEITFKRMNEHPLNGLKKKFDQYLKDFDIHGAQIAISHPFKHFHSIQLTCLGEDSSAKHLFEIASLSKTIGTALALEVFSQYNIDENSLVIDLLEEYGSSLKLDEQFRKHLKIKHLMSHSALNMHYVNGVPLKNEMPKIEAFLNGNDQYGYESIQVLHPPATKFQYSGAGFIVLEHLVELVSKKSIKDLSEELFQKLGLLSMTFDHHEKHGYVFTDGYHSKNNKIENDRLKFPSFAAGGYATAYDMQKFMHELSQSFDGKGEISQMTAAKMLFDKDLHSDIGSFEFMQARVGLGLFVLEAGDNRWALHQGANDGFRAIYLHCFEGEDKGKGLTIFAHGGLNAVQFISKVTQDLLKELGCSGIDFTYFDRIDEGFNIEGILPEEIVNQGYKYFLFNAFEPCLPDAIHRNQKVDSILSQSLILKPKILKVTNQRFARAENLFSPYPPVFDPELFCEQGKVMDSWESARHNLKEYETLEFELENEVTIDQIYLSTKYHFGNQVEWVKIDYEFNGEYFELLPKTKMIGHAFRALKLKSEIKSKKFRILAGPDGGLTRVAFYHSNQILEGIEFESIVENQCETYRDMIPVPLKPLSLPVQDEELLAAAKYNQLPAGELFDNACLSYGAKLIHATNEHYGPAIQLISPTPPIHMFDGLESARTRETGHYEEVIIELAEKKVIETMELDFHYFRNNNPREIILEGLINDTDWVELSPRLNVKPFAGRKLRLEISEKQPVSRVKLITVPDGGVNRLHVYSRK